MNYWSELGLEPTSDRRAVKKAYSTLLKKHRPDQDPEGYQRLREAYDWANAECRKIALREEERQSASEESFSNDSPTPDADAVSDAANDVNPQSSPAEIDVPSDEDSWADNSVPAQEATVTDPRQQIEQAAYDAAYAAAEKVFTADSMEIAEAELDKALHSAELMNIKARAYFEHICLDTLARWEPNELPHALVAAAAKEFRWFDEQHSDVDKAQRVAYLNARRDAYNTYWNAVVQVANTSNSDVSEKAAAKLISRNYRPLYFHFVRFIGVYNRTIRRYTRYFAPAVAQDICPELDTQSFHWWRERMERSLFSLWHIVVGFLALLLVSAIFEENIPTIADELRTASIVSVSVLLGLVTWGVDAIYLHTHERIIHQWRKIETLSSTRLILTAIFILSVLVWRANGDIDNINWLIVLALATAFLFFRSRDFLTFIWSSLTYILCYGVIDVLGRHPEQASLALIIAFVAQCVFAWLITFAPARVTIPVMNHTFLRFFTATVVAAILSVGYLNLIIFIKA